jgi:hypothetical protein|tara:strand:- start:398 stop:928 length:531 start_codon:yes stop_codon:yes gene_type:complete
MEKNLEIHTISKVDICCGRTSINLDGLSDLILDNASEKLDSDPSHTHYEDTICPDSPIIDKIINEMICAFKGATGFDIELTDRWSHIHEKNMSTTLHDHYPSDISSAFYVSVPDNAGQIVFHPSHNRYHPARVSIPPEEGMYLMFPGYLDHSVTRNQSKEKRISLAFNFNILQGQQ